MIAWWPFSRRRRQDPFTQIKGQDLDLAMPTPNDLSAQRHEELRARVRTLVGELQPGALDAGSREVLNNLINAWADQELAELDAGRDERQAVADVLIGLAAEQVARRKPRYEADLAQVAQTATAMEVTFEALTGHRPADYVPPRPRPPADQPIASTLGPVGPPVGETAVAPAVAPAVALAVHATTTSDRHREWDADGHREWDGRSDGRA